MLLAGRQYIYDLTTPLWLGNLFQKEAFSQVVQTLYREELHPLLEKQLEDDHWNVYEQQVSEAAAVNAIRCHAGEPEAELVRLKEFLAARVAFLDSLWISEDPYCKVYLSSGIGTWSCFAVRPGEILTHLPPAEDPYGRTFIGWFDAFTEASFDITQPIYEDAVIQMKWE